MLKMDWQLSLQDQSWTEAEFKGSQSDGIYDAFLLCLRMGLTFLISLMDYTQNSIIIINRL